MISKLKSKLEMLKKIKQNKTKTEWSRQLRSDLLKKNEYAELLICYTNCIFNSRTVASGFRRVAACIIAPR